MSNQRIGSIFVVTVEVFSAQIRAGVKSRYACFANDFVPIFHQNMLIMVHYGLESDCFWADEECRTLSDPSRFSGQLLTKFVLEWFGEWLFIRFDI